MDPEQDKSGKGVNMLKLTNVSLGYDGHPDTLHNISIEVNKAEMLALIGKNGAGKTTLRIDRAAAASFRQNHLQ